MALADTTVLAVMKEKMQWLTQRQRVLSQNIANADTPNYLAHDLKPLDFRQVLRDENSKITLARTHHSHLVGAGDNDHYAIEKTAEGYEISPNGNGVALDEQLLKVNETVGEYRLASQVIRKYTTMYQIALGRGGATA